MKQADLIETCWKRPPGVYTSTVVVRPDPLPPTPSTSLSMKIPENKEKDLDNPKLADEGDIQRECSSD